jgi:hypothetical protein
MSTKLTIPGDSIEENAFLSSVTVETAFLYSSLYWKKLNGMESPYRINQHITSFAEYTERFGGAFHAKFF